MGAFLKIGKNDDFLSFSKACACTKPYKFVPVFIGDGQSLCEVDRSMRFQKYECRKVANAKPCFIIRRDIQSGSG
jgi:hypothetical protein